MIQDKIKQVYKEIFMLKELQQFTSKEEYLKKYNKLESKLFSLLKAKYIFK